MPSFPSVVYFSIGEAVAAVALLIAISQLIRPIIKFRLNVSKFKLHYFYALFIFSIYLVFMAAIIPFSPYEFNNKYIRYPVFWEISAGIIFVIGVLVFLYIANKRAIFDYNSYEIFTSGCTSIIARGKEEDIGELAEELYFSMKNIVNASNAYSQIEYIIAKKEGRPYEIKKHTQYALFLLKLLSDEKLCRIIVCNIPQTAIEFFSQTNQQKAYEAGGYAFSNQIIQQAYLNKQSLLHREEDYIGLGHINSFTKAVFGNYEFVRSRFYPLDAWESWKDEDIYPWKIDKYSKTLCVALGSYFNSGQWYDDVFPFNRAFEKLESLAMSQSISFNKTLASEIYSSLAHKNLSSLAQCYRNLIKELAKNEHLLPNYDFEADKYDYTEDHSIYGSFAHGIYEFLDTISIISSHEDSIRIIIISLWMEIYPVSAAMENKSIKEVQKRLNIHLLKKVEENLTQLYYPAVNRFLINVMGIWEPNETEKMSGEYALKKGLIYLLKEHYKKSIKKDPKKALDMIPEKVRYDEEREQLIQTTPSGHQHILNI